MPNLKDTANSYIPPTTRNISELDNVFVNIEVRNKIVHEGEHDQFSYDYITVDEEDYRVPKTVIAQLKVQLEANPDLKLFSVSRTGEGMKTAYTVIPISE